MCVNSNQSFSVVQNYKHNGTSGLTEEQLEEISESNRGRISDHPNNEPDNVYYVSRNDQK